VPPDRRFEPANLVMLDRDESALHAVQLSIEGRACWTPTTWWLPIRDRDRIVRGLREHRPEVVFHAAALKHLPLLEMHPAEAVKTNVWGTQNLLTAGHGVERFVNISTDKAADPPACSATPSASPSGSPPTWPAGPTARTCRCGSATCWAAGLGAAAFRAQIEAGGPVTVTDPEVTRYFMTVEEAVQLVIQAGAIGRDGEALVLDMGEPVRIDEVARRLIARPTAHRDRLHRPAPGEKLHEVLFATARSTCARCTR
jgi:FlaA1/EpsC-like NDP-sugar epimerase